MAILFGGAIGANLCDWHNAEPDKPVIYSSSGSGLRRGIRQSVDVGVRDEMIKPATKPGASGRSASGKVAPASWPGF
jgi:hypothetical protein